MYIYAERNIHTLQIHFVIRFLKDIRFVIQGDLVKMTIMRFNHDAHRHYRQSQTEEVDSHKFQKKTHIKFCTCTYMYIYYSDLKMPLQI